MLNILRNLARASADMAVCVTYLFIYAGALFAGAYGAGWILYNVFTLI